MKRLYVSATLILLFAGQAIGQLYRLENDEKIGGSVLYHNSPSIEVTHISTNAQALSSEPYSGGLLFYERIFRSQLGLAVGVGLIRQNVDARILSTDTSIENRGQVLHISGRSYFDRHRKQGTNFHIGAEFNWTNLASRFLVANELLEDETSKATLYTYGLFGGGDFLFSNSGLRFNVGYMFGETADNDSVDDIYVKYSFNTLYFQLGTFIFF